MTKKKVVDWPRKRHCGQQRPLKPTMGSCYAMSCYCCRNARMIIRSVSQSVCSLLESHGWTADSRVLPTGSLTVCSLSGSSLLNTTWDNCRRNSRQTWRTNLDQHSPGATCLKCIPFPIWNRSCFFPSYWNWAQWGTMLMWCFKCTVDTYLQSDKPICCQSWLGLLDVP